MVEGHRTVEVNVTGKVIVDLTVLVVTLVFGQEVEVKMDGTKRVLVRRRVLVVTEVTVWVTVTKEVLGKKSVSVTVVTPMRIELV